MTPLKKKLLKPKEVSLGPSLTVETPIVELPNDENKLYDEEDDVRTSTIPDLSLPSEDEEEEVKSNNFWEYAIDVLNGSNIKKRKPWSSFTDGMKMT